jgi:cytochrome c peroxidase
VFSDTGVGKDLSPFVAAVATIDTCTPVVVGNQPGGVFTLFESWENLNDTPGNAGRLSVARGEVVFNKTGCVNCHAVPNLGNNPSGLVFKNIGTDSLETLQMVKAGKCTGLPDPGFPATCKSNPTADEQALVQDMIQRVSQLPLYCLKPIGDTTLCDDNPNHPANHTLTTDPGRALFTGKQADSGFFKPPLLRDLGVRDDGQTGYFHGGAAPDLKHVVNYKNLRFNFGLTADEQADLVNFLSAL